MANNFTYKSIHQKAPRLIVCMTLIIASVIFLAACHKSAPAPVDTGFATDQSTAVKTFLDAITAADVASITINGDNAYYRTAAVMGSNCATIERSIANSGSYKGDSLFSINFGTYDCTCIDQSFRRGLISVYYKGTYSDSGNIIYITFINQYYQNNNTVLGTMTITNMGHNASGQPYYNVTTNGQLIYYGTTDTVKIYSNMIRTCVQQDSVNIYNVYTSSATNIMIRPNGDTVGITVPVNSPLVIASNCRWMEAGIVNYTLPKNKTAKMNYGNTANCDDAAILTYNTKTYNITMP